ncbi:MAG: hypothetical protein GAK28_04238 [Luteibacter sp.]|uniref:hypothetical protein n=1 Tax=Luteibacter sp. TaxID=1886636 RepID=UPI0013817BFA|nr:hypothetical protein [Luteibacter sp.]KAF1004074.1 MAG: hypothetical protein GAK28_04238 [Luteibacter sp.]
MIKADIALHDLSLDPTWSEGSIILGTSRITPYRHTMLETVLVQTTDQWFVSVRERRASSTDAGLIRHDVDDTGFHRLYQESLLWPLDYVMIEVARAGHRVRVRSGVFGSVPVYCRATDDHLAVSWDSADFGRGPAAIDAEIASHQLAMRTIYSARQLYVGVVMLTERAILHVQPGKASFRYPEAIPPTIPSSEGLGEEALSAFSEGLQRVIAQRPMREGGASVELSGGMDSGTVATALTMHHRGIASRGILLDGDFRLPQLQRRDLIVQRRGLLDDTVEIADHAPSLDLSASPDRPYGLYRELYLEACSALWESSRCQGRDTLFTGVGGDELFPTYSGELSDGDPTDPGWASDTLRYAEGLLTPRALSAARSLRTFDAPASPVPATSLLAHASHAPDLLRHGQWPINPLSDPHLVALCHRFPKASRQGREVMRQYLQSHLGDDTFQRGYVKETFVNVLPPLFAKHATTLALQLSECALADIGLVDRRAVLDLLQRVATTSNHGATSALASFLWLERFARQVGA